jgi:hypothetical protein
MRKIYMKNIVFYLASLISSLPLTDSAGNSTLTSTESATPSSEADGIMLKYSSPEHSLSEDQLESDQSEDYEFQRRVKLYAQASGVTYCPSVWQKNLFQCGENCKGNLKDFQMSLAYNIESVGASGFFGYLPNENTILASFRGTQTVNGAILNMKITKSDPDFVQNNVIDDIPGRLPDSSPEVHIGFEKIYIESKETIQSNLNQLIQKYPTANIVFTGHSLGGAIANLAAYDFSRINERKYDDKLSIYSYGQPRVGNAEWNESFSQLSFSKRYYRIIQKGDPVTQLPPQKLGYIHNGIPYLISSSNEFTKCPNVGPGGESEECNTEFKSRKFIYHSLIEYYFQQMAEKCV